MLPDGNVIGQIIFMKAVINADDGGEIYSWKYMFYHNL